MKTVVEKFRTEPAVITGFISAAIALGIAFGLSLTAEQVGVIMAFVVALMQLFVRSQVSPTIKISAEKNAAGQDVAGEGLANENPDVTAGDPVEVTPTNGSSVWENEL